MSEERVKELIVNVCVVWTFVLIIALAAIGVLGLLTWLGMGS